MINAEAPVARCRMTNTSIFFSFSHIRRFKDHRPGNGSVRELRALVFVLVCVLGRVHTVAFQSWHGAVFQAVLRFCKPPQHVTGAIKLSVGW